VYYFGGAAGMFPQLADLLFDNQGNIYGVTCEGGSQPPNDYGVVYELTPSSGGWSETVIHAFTGDDGACPLGSLVFDANGNLYGTTWQGGASYYYGTVFELMRSGSGWLLDTLHTFAGGTDGATPISGVLLDGNAVIATTTQQGAADGGTAAWLNNNLFHYDFPGTSDYYNGPWGTLVGTSTDLYGTTFGDGAYGKGSIFHLQGCAGWGYTSLHDFAGPEGANPAANVLIDRNGNMFGTTSQGGAYGYGVVFEITMAQQSDGLHRDSGCSQSLNN
jgi:uncharacterized repeat protein (TIGR03803 family)